MFKALIAAAAVASLALPLALMPDALAYFALDYVFESTVYHDPPAWLVAAVLIIVTPFPLYVLGKYAVRVYRIERLGLKEDL